MAINALGLPLILQTSTAQLQDLLGSLQPGDTMRGRLVELLPQDKAVINLQGQNVVAQLPAGRIFQRGDVLTLQVSQASAAEAGKAASLQLRLLPGAPAAATALPPGSPALSTQAQLEQALSAARLPVNSVTLTVAQTLARLGAPLDAPSLTTAVQATEALLANETAPPAALPQTPLQDPQVQLALRESLAQLKVAAQLSPSSQNAVLLQQAARSLEAALASMPTVAEQPATAVVTLPTEPTASPAQAPLEVPSGTGMAAPEAAPVQAAVNAAGGAQAAQPSLDAGQLSVAIEHAVAQLVVAPSPAQAQVLADLLVQAAAPPAQSQQTAVAAPPAVAVNSSITSPSTSPAPAAAGGSAAPAAPSTPVPSAVITPPLISTPGTQAANTQLDLPALPVQREVLAQWLGQVRQAPGPVQAQTLAQSARTLAAALLDPTQAPAQQLLAAVQVQTTVRDPQATLQTARQALLDVAEHFSQLAAQQPGRTLASSAAVQAEVDSLGLPTPRVTLANLPPETVAEAVAWLQARDLPPQRPLVETVATWLDQDRSVVPAAQKAVEAAAGLPSSVTDQMPGLKAAIADAQQALQASAVKPEDSGLAARLQQWAKDQGLTLENSLAQSLKLPDTSNAAVTRGAHLSPDAPGLRPALMKLEHELQQALRDPLAQAPNTAGKLEQALKEVQSSVRSLSALPLQAQSAPTFDTVHLPLPMWMNGQIGAGNLSVTWRNGRERGLDDKEPVNVAVALKTESLGEVKVLLQVWKNVASARVIAETPEAADFLKTGAAELRDGFNERTPFQLQALDFEAAKESGPQDPSGPDAPRSGLSLSA